MVKVFVYGTLKSGFWNHRLLKDVPFVEAVTVDKFAMESQGIPYMLRGDHARVKGEVYDVDAVKLKELDRLEGYQEDRPSNYYWRETIKVEANGECVEAFAYISRRRAGERPYTHVDENGFLDWDPKHEAPYIVYDDVFGDYGDDEEASVR